MKLSFTYAVSGREVMPETDFILDESLTHIKGRVALAAERHPESVLIILPDGRHFCHVGAEHTGSLKVFLLPKEHVDGREELDQA